MLAERFQRYNSAESREDYYGYSNYASAFRTADVGTGENLEYLHCADKNLF